MILHYAEKATIVADDIDGYNSRGITLSRDAVHVVIAALSRDAYEMERRGGEPNLEAAKIQRDLVRAIGKALDS